MQTAVATDGPGAGLGFTFEELKRRKHDAHAAAARRPWWSRDRLVYYSFDQCPHHLQDNDFIRSGYRAFYSTKEAWISLFHLHNETLGGDGRRPQGNVWTHFAPFFVAAGAIAWFLLSGGLHPNATTSDHAVVCIFLACSAYTFITSSLFHLHLCGSRAKFVFYGCLDYSGISASICGGSGSVAFYVLFCDPKARAGWLTALGIVNLVGIVGPMFKFWTGPAFRTGRAVIYLTSGALSCAPVIYFISEHGFDALPSASTSRAIPSILAMLALYVVGAMVYVFRIPERFWPGAFDYAFHSHMNWHLFVVVAMVMNFQGLLALMQWRLDAGRVCSI
ncbi:inc metabolism membrane protein [Polyrhizophydium stewartii]|uniref:Inc metabolism membrane protein n=1 Tax=Polyrhizophydium stewartii TaxID=2732419 RepID=A0ABR4NK72_9FUNG